jgi:hypothetical protein
LILGHQEKQNPDADPGDMALTIDIQDDSAMTSLWQNRRMLGAGGSIQDCLENAARAVIGGLPDEPTYQDQDWPPPTIKAWIEGHSVPEDRLVAELETWSRLARRPPC